MAAEEFTFERLSGAEIVPLLKNLAALRIEVFREFPYLYDGDERYELRYLQTYVNSPRSLVVLVRDGDKLIGATTGLPMRDETAEFQRPFLDQGYDVDRIFYCGESVLRREYRGRGIYKHLFEAREHHARNLGGFELCTFCCVERAQDHPLRPKDYVPLDSIWRRFEYTEQLSLTTSYVWKDVDQPHETSKTMRYWIKSLMSPQANS